MGSIKPIERSVGIEVRLVGNKNDISEAWVGRNPDLISPILQF